MKQLLLSVLVFANVSWAAAQDCKLPVCNMQSKIEEMATMNQDGRFSVVNEMKVKYKTETNPEVLTNLVEFSIQALALMVEKGDEAYVLREPEYMKNTAIQSLVKYDKINKDLMIKRFSQVTGEAAAFEILTHWAVEVEKLDDIAEVLQVTGFAEFAKQWAIDTKQEAYVVREADRILIVGGKRVSQLNPFHEGAYQVRLTCMSDLKDACGVIPKSITHMSIFDSLTTQGLMVNLADAQLSAPMFIYTTSLLTNNGKHIRGISTDATPTTRVSEIDLDVDMLTGKVTGILIDAQYGEMKIEGIPVRRMSEFYTDKGPSRVVQVVEILGRYKGTLAGTESELVVSRYSSGELNAVINFGGSSTLNFRAGAYNTKRGVLQFAANGGAMGYRKLVLALRTDKKGREVLSGFMLTATPKTPAAEFTKVSAK